MVEVALALSIARLGPPNEPPPIPRELRAVWVATVANIDWPLGRTNSVASQQNQIVNLLNRFQELNLNAVFLQIRPQCDALYPSPIEPWSEYLTNVMGTPPLPWYDPLLYWITEARARGMEVHAWFNPYRALHTTHRNGVHPSHVTVTRPHLAKHYAGMRWLDPGWAETREYALSVIMDVVNRYDLDGVHFDDYFYPYPDGNPFPDDDSYAAYLSGGGQLSRANWRRWNVDTFVFLVYASIKAAKPWVKFGISPFGIWQPGHPPGVTGLNAYASLYADSRKWLREGWVDYMTPQLYWRISSTGQPYGNLLDWWIEQNW